MCSLANISVKYVSMRALEHPLNVAERADLISQEELDGRVVLYRDTLSSIVEEFEDDDFYSEKDKMFLTDLETEYIDLDENEEQYYPDWYIFE